MGLEKEDELARKAFAKRLKTHIARRDLSHRQLAGEAQVALQSVTEWTQARREPNLRQLRRLSNALEVPLAALVEDQPTSSVADAPRLLDELVKLGIGSTVQRLSDSTPSLLELLSEAERIASDQKRT